MPDLGTILAEAQRQLAPDDFRVFLALVEYAQTHTPNEDGSYSFDLDQLAQRLDRRPKT